MIYSVRRDVEKLKRMVLTKADPKEVTPEDISEGRDNDLAQIEFIRKPSGQKGEFEYFILSKTGEEERLFDEAFYNELVSEGGIVVKQPRDTYSNLLDEVRRWKTKIVPLEGIYQEKVPNLGLLVHLLTREKLFSLAFDRKDREHVKSAEVSSRSESSLNVLNRTIYQDSIGRFWNWDGKEGVYKDDTTELQDELAIKISDLYKTKEALSEEVMRQIQSGKYDPAQIDKILRVKGLKRAVKKEISAIATSIPAKYSASQLAELERRSNSYLEEKLAEGRWYNLEGNEN